MSDLQKRLTPEQYRVTQLCGTEPPFANEYWDNHAEGLYVDVVSGEVLFSSKDKFDSGTGWPSFTRPAEGVALVEKSDLAHGMRDAVPAPSAESISNPVIAVLSRAVLEIRMECTPTWM